MLPGAERCAPAAPSRVQPRRLPGEPPGAVHRPPSIGTGQRARSRGTGYGARTAEHRHRAPGAAHGSPDAAPRAGSDGHRTPDAVSRAPGTGCSLLPVSVPDHPPVAPRGRPQRSRPPCPRPARPETRVDVAAGPGAPRHHKYPGGRSPAHSAGASRCRSHASRRAGAGAPGALGSGPLLPLQHAGGEQQRAVVVSPPAPGRGVGTGLAPARQRLPRTQGWGAQV